MASQKIIPLALAALLALATPAFATSNILLPGNSGSSTNSGSNNSSVADPVCDADVFERMKQKAWMEAQRENYVNQTIITAPNSIFDQTCYKKQLGVTMDKLGLDESSGSSTSKDKFEEDVADNANIVNEFVGPVNNGNSTSKDTSKPTASSDFECEEMSKYWQTAQCGNFAGGNLPSLTEAGATGNAKESRKYVDSSGQVQSCQGKDDTKDTTGLFKFSQAQQDTMGTASAPGPNLPGYNKVDLRRCMTEPYSVISTLKNDSGQDLCPTQAGGDKCWPGKELNVPWPQNTNLTTISCPNDGCEAVEKNGKLVCAKSP